MTLVEVLGGLAILGGLLVAILVASGKYTKQRALGERRIQATRAADRLLSGWWQDKDALRPGDSGDLPETAMRWRVSSLDEAPIDGLAARVIRLEIMESRESGPALASVDVLWPKESPHAP